MGGACKLRLFSVRLQNVHLPAPHHNVPDTAIKPSVLPSDTAPQHSRGNSKPRSPNDDTPDGIRMDIQRTFICVTSRKTSAGGVRCAPPVGESSLGDRGMLSMALLEVEIAGTLLGRRATELRGRPRSAPRERSWAGDTPHRDTQPPHMCLQPAESRAAVLSPVTSSLRLGVLMSINI